MSRQSKVSRPTPGKNCLRSSHTESKTSFQSVGNPCTLLGCVDPLNCTRGVLFGFENPCTLETRRSRVCCVQYTTCTRNFKTGAISKEIRYWRFFRKGLCWWARYSPGFWGGVGKKNGPCDRRSGKMGTVTSLYPMGCVQQHRQSPPST